MLERIGAHPINRIDELLLAGESSIDIGYKYPIAEDLGQERTPRTLTKVELFERMIQARPGTPPQVSAELQIGRVRSLSDLCTMILAYEAAQLNPADIPDMKARVRAHLIKKGIPEDLA